MSRRIRRSKLHPATAIRRALKHLNSLSVFTWDERGEPCIRGGRAASRRLVLAISNLEAGMRTIRNMQRGKR